jgi:hypothetical protein
MQFALGLGTTFTRMSGIHRGACAAIFNPIINIMKTKSFFLALCSMTTWALAQMGGAGAATGACGCRSRIWSNRNHVNRSCAHATRSASDCAGRALGSKASTAGWPRRDAKCSQNCCHQILESFSTITTKSPFEEPMVTATAIGRTTTHCHVPTDFGFGTSMPSASHKSIS